MRRRCIYNKFSGALIGIRLERGALIGDGALVGQGANSNFYGEALKPRKLILKEGTIFVDL